MESKYNINKQEYSFRTTDYAQEIIPEAVLDENDPIYQIQQLAGVSKSNLQEFSTNSMLSDASQKIEYQNTNNIQPGTPEWFRLWFAKPQLTGENPFQ